MRRRAATRVLGWGALAASLLGCSPDYVGSWSAPAEWRAVAFHEDHRFELVDEGAPRSGTWEAVDDGRVRWTLDGEETTASVSVDGDELTLELPGADPPLVYRRDPRSPREVHETLRVTDTPAGREAAREEASRLEAEARALRERQRREEAAQAPEEPADAPTEDAPPGDAPPSAGPEDGPRP